MNRGNERYMGLGNTGLEIRGEGVGKYGNLGFGNTGFGNTGLGNKG